jgi:hypothetical protein
MAQLKDQISPSFLSRVIIALDWLMLIQQQTHSYILSFLPIMIQPQTSPTHNQLILHIWPVYIVCALLNPRSLTRNRPTQLQQKQTQQFCNNRNYLSLAVPITIGFTPFYTNRNSIDGIGYIKPNSYGNQASLQTPYGFASFLLCHARMPLHTRF